MLPASIGANDVAVYPADVTEEMLRRFLAEATRGAKRASNDPQVVEEAAGYAVAQLGEFWDRVSTGERERRAWLGVVARNHARRVGAKLHRDLAMGRAGSEPPPMHEEQADERVALLIADIHVGGGSLGSLVAMNVDFDRRWMLLSGETRALLHAKYVQGKTSKAIALERARGESPGAIDDKLKAARRAARVVLNDLLDERRDRGDDG